MSDADLKKFMLDYTKENREENRKLKAAQQKTDAAQQKTDAALKETAATLKETLKETMAALADFSRETRAGTRELRKQLGGIGNTQGEIAEDLFRRNFKSLIQKRGYQLDGVDHRLKAPGGHEYDLVGTNGKVVVLAEVKSKLSHRTVKNLIRKQIPAFRDDFPKYKKHKLIGCLAGLVVGKGVEEIASHLGLFVLTQKGKDGAQIVNSPDFKAKEY